MRFQHKLFSIVSLTVLLLLSAQTTFAHGSIEEPASRSLGCYNDDPMSPVSAACQAALAEGEGTQQFYDWHEVNLLAGGQHRELIQDGELCSASRDKYAGLDLARDDWPATYIYPDENGQYEFVFWAWAPHSTDYFDFYVTKDDYDPLQPINWSTLEDDPFCTITEVSLTTDARYKMTCDLPTNKTGRHLIYNIWQRDDTPEAFYSCSDVIFVADETEVPTPTPNPEPGDCNSPVWVSAVVYLEGDLVTYAGREWQAGWWTKGDEPGTTGQHGVWQEVGVCDGSVTPTATPSVPTPTATTPPVTPTATSIPPTGTPTPTETPSAETARIEIDDHTAAPDDSITIPLKGYNFPTVGALTVNITFDSTQLTLTNCEADPNSQFDSGLCNVGSSSASLSLIDITGVSGDTTLANLTFDVIGEAGDSTTVTPAVVTLADTVGSTINSTTRAGELSISSGLLGDVNCDQSQTAVDALYILQYTVAAWSGGNDCPPAAETIYLPLCDVDGSGYCDVTDALFVLQCTVGINNVLCPSNNRSMQQSASDAPISLAVAGSQRDLVVEADISAEIPTDQTLAATTILLHYDSATLKPIGCTLASNVTGTCNHDLAAGSMAFSILSAEGLTGDAPLGSAEFRTIGAGDVTFEADSTKLTNVTGQDVEGISAETILNITSATTAVQTEHISIANNGRNALIAALFVLTFATARWFRVERWQ